ncbi:MAG TPA: TetR/AcrR family transcriptional regulator [Phenylobacterium sp.]|jgi:AcrR family transcriptional regulator
MTAPDDSPPNLRDRQKAQTRELIVEALFAALAAGRLEEATHDALAKRVGISRQTVYRHFPDRDALMTALWEHLNPRFTARGMPTTEADLTELLAPMFTAFDRDAEIITFAQSTPQGRAMRLAVRDRRSAAFRQATAAATEGLSEREARLAAAVIQLLHGGQAWIEMRQQWGLSGDEMATACGWAIRTLLRDLHARQGRPLEEPPPGT